MRRKAQMEIIGLVVIVILITLGMLFMAQFALKEDPSKKIFTRKGLAYSTMSALMKTTLECNGEQLQLQSDLLKDCASNKESGYYNYNCGDNHEDSCKYLQDKITKFLERTLGHWGKNYQFDVHLISPNGALTSLFDSIQKGDGCTAKERDTSGLFPLRLEQSGLVECVLYICD